MRGTEGSLQSKRSIDHIYARLRGSRVFSTFDSRSGYHPMELSPEARVISFCYTYGQI